MIVNFVGIKFSRILLRFLSMIIYEVLGVVFELSLASEARLLSIDIFVCHCFSACKTKQACKASSRYSLKWQCVASHRFCYVFDNKLATGLVSSVKTKIFCNCNRVQLEMLQEGFKQSRQ